MAKQNLAILNGKNDPFSSFSPSCNDSQQCEHPAVRSVFPNSRAGVHVWLHVENRQGDPRQLSSRSQERGQVWLSGEGGPGRWVNLQLQKNKSRELAESAEVTSRTQGAELPLTWTDRALSSERG